MELPLRGTKRSTTTVCQNVWYSKTRPAFSPTKSFTENFEEGKLGLTAENSIQAPVNTRNLFCPQRTLCKWARTSIMKFISVLTQPREQQALFSGSSSSGNSTNTISSGRSARFAIFVCSYRNPCCHCHNVYMVLALLLWLKLVIVFVTVATIKLQTKWILTEIGMRELQLQIPATHIHKHTLAHKNTRPENFVSIHNINNKKNGCKKN